MAFTINNGVLEKYVPEPDELDIVIPDDVVKIGEKVFKGRNIKSVVIPSSVKVIEKNAFESCNNLTKVTFSNGLEKIGERAFYCCSIDMINIPETVKTIGKNAFSYNYMKSINIPEKIKHISKDFFAGCRKLEEICVSERNQHYTFVDGVLFSKDMKTLICYPSGRKDNCYAIPDGVEVIQKESFLSCHNLKSLIFPASMKWIDRHSFSTCRIEHITIPDCEMIMSDRAFYSTQIPRIITITGKNINIKASTYGYTLSPDTVRLIRCVTFAPCFKDKFFAEIKDTKFKVISALFLLFEYDYPVVKAYVSRNIRHIVKYLIDTEDAENLTKLLYTGYVTKKNIGDFINYAIKSKSPEIQIILSNFRNDSIGFDNSSFNDLLL